MAFSVILFVLVLQFLSRYADELFGKGVETSVLFQVFLYTCATLVTLALPLAVLLSSLLTMGNMGERYELAAMKSAGISLFRTMWPMLLFTLVVTSLSLLFSFWVMPKANLKMYSIIFDMQKVKPSFNLQDGYFYKGIDGYVIRARRINRETDMLYDIRINDHTDPAGSMKVTFADSGRMKPNKYDTALELRLYHGSNTEKTITVDSTGRHENFNQAWFDSLQYEISLSGFTLERTSEETFKTHQYMIEIVELYVATDSLEEEVDSLRGDLAEYMYKYMHLYEGKAREEIPLKFAPEEMKRRMTVARNLKLEGDDAADSIQASIPDSLKWSIPSGNNFSSSGSILEQVAPDDHRRGQIIQAATSNARAIKNYAKHLKSRLATEEEKYRKYDIELQFRIVLPIACIVFLFIGAPLGAIIRKGGVGMPVIISIIFFIIFYILMIQGKKFARDDIFPVVIGVWLPIIVLFPLALLFTYQSATDSPMMFASRWQTLFFRIEKFFKRISPFGRKRRAYLAAKEAEYRAKRAVIWDETPEDGKG